MSGPSVRCFGACGGVAGWIDPDTGVACTLCQGSGIWKYPPSPAEEYAAVRRARDALHARGRAMPAPRPSLFRPAKRPRKGSKAARAADRASGAIAARRAAERELAAFRASRPADWSAQLDALKAEFQATEKERRRHTR